jgi:hypothetical protein
VPQAVEATELFHQYLEHLLHIQEVVVQEVMKQGLLVLAVRAEVVMVVPTVLVEMLEPQTLVAVEVVVEPTLQDLFEGQAVLAVQA